MYRSTDNGTSWVQINNGLPEARIYSIGISRSVRNHDNIFVATHGAGVFRSTNNGERWYRVGFSDTSKYIESIAIDLEGNVFASAHHIWYDRSTLYRSTDNGAYWEVTEIDNPLVNTATISLLIPTTGKYKGKLFAGTNWGIYRSENFGNNWERIVPVGTNFAVNSLAINYKGEIYAAASDSAVYKSVDSGMNWSHSKVTNDKVLSLAVTPNGVLFAATYGSGMYRSLDDGKTWHSLQSGLDNELMLSVVYADAGDYSTYVYAGGTGLGTFRSRNSTTPFALNRYDILFGDVKVGQTKTDSIVVTNMDTTDLSITRPLLPEYFTITPADTTLPVGGSVKYYVTFEPTWYDTIESSAIFNSTANSSSDEVLIFGIGRAPDTRLLQSGLAYGRVFLGKYSEMSVRIKNTGNDTLRFTNIYTSDSVFNAWSDVPEVLPREYAYITIKFTPRLHGPYAGFTVIESNSMSSPDTIWMNGFGRGYPVPFMNVAQVKFGNVKVGNTKDTSLSITNIGEDTLWISKFESNNSEFSVIIDKSPVPPGETRKFTVRFSPYTKGEVFAAIFLYSNALSSPDSIIVHGLGDPPTEIKTLEGIPTEFALYQNYPNPFNPSTTFRFALPQEGAVRITLYNQLGEIVSTVVEEVLPAGYYETFWRNSGFPSGVYYYRFIVNEVRSSDDQNTAPPSHRIFEEMRKLVLMK